MTVDRRACAERVTHLVPRSENTDDNEFLPMPGVGVRALHYQKHEALRRFFGFQEMVKRSVAIPSNGLHIYAARTWGVHPHATVSVERSEGRQNPVSRASDHGRHCSALFKSEEN